MATPEKKYKRKKKKVGSYQYGLVVFCITLALLGVGFFGLLSIYANELTNSIRDNFEVSIFLNKEVSQNQRNRIENELSASPYLLQKEDKEAIRFKSKQEAADEFLGDSGDDFTDFLGENPLKDALIINITPEFQEDARLDSIRNHIQSISGVFEVDYNPSILNKIQEARTSMSLFLIIFAAIMILIVVFIVNSTIKLALFSQRFLIRSMQLVGATPSFIRRPFLSRSFMHGVLAGIIASGALFGFLQFANAEVDQLIELQNDIYIFALFGVLVVLGGLIALISTNRATGKYLKMSLDELY